MGAMTKAFALVAAVGIVSFAAGACSSLRAHEEHIAKASGYVRASTERAARGRHRTAEPMSARRL